MVNFIQQFWYLNNSACEKKTPRLKLAKEFVCQVSLYVNEHLSSVALQHAYIDKRSS